MTKSERKPWRCFDCGHPFVDYYVRDEIWLQAWPDYQEAKAEAIRQYSGTEHDRLKHLTLCFTCLERRLGRVLSPDDFNLSLPANAGIRLGIGMGLTMKRSEE